MRTLTAHVTAHVTGHTCTCHACLAILGMHAGCDDVGVLCGQVPPWTTEGQAMVNWQAASQHFDEHGRPVQESFVYQVCGRCVVPHASLPVLVAPDAWYHMAA